MNIDELRKLRDAAPNRIENTYQDRKRMAELFYTTAHAVLPDVLDELECLRLVARAIAPIAPGLANVAQGGGMSVNLLDVARLLAALEDVATA